jgi:hypothetical protein
MSIGLRSGVGSEIGCGQLLSGVGTVEVQGTAWHLRRWCTCSVPLISTLRIGPPLPLARPVAITSIKQLITLLNIINDNLISNFEQI